MAKRKTEIEVSLKDGATRGLQGLVKSIKAVGAGIAETTKLAREATNQLVELGAKTAAIGTVGLGAGFAVAVKDAANFEAVLKEIVAVAGGAEGDFDRLKNAAVTAAKETGFSFEESAGGLGELARATGDVESAVASLSPVLNLARAGLIAVDKAAEITSTTLTQFGLGFEQAGRVADVLAQAANSTTASVEQLGNSLSYAAPLARNLGLDLEETVAIIGALADQGFRGERAGTALRNVLSSLSDPASKFSGALSDLGIRSRDFVTVLQELRTRGSAANTAILALDAEARPAILSLVRDGGAAIRQLSADLDAAEGSAKRVSAEVIASLNGAFSLLGNTIRDIADQAASPFLDPFADAILRIQARLEAFLASEQFPKLLEQIEEFASKAADALATFVENLDFEAAAESVATFVAQSSEAMSQFGETVTGVAQNIGAAFDGLSVVFNAFQAGIFAIAGAVTRVFAEILQAVQITADGISYLPEQLGIINERVVDLSEQVGGLRAVSDEFFERSASNARETGAAWDDFKESVDGATESTVAAGDAATEATPKVGGFVEMLRTLAPGAAAAADGLLAAADAAGKMGAQADQASGPVQDLSGDLVALGESTKESLQANADAALANVAIIQEQVREGIASQQDLVDAQLKAQQAITRASREGAAAQKNSADQALITREETERLADAHHRAGQAGSSAGNSTAGAYANAAGQIRSAGQATEQLVDSFERAREAGALAGAEIGKLSGQYNRAAASLGEVSDEFSRLAAEGLQALIQGGVSGRAQVDRLNEGLAAQNREYAEINERLDRQIQGYNQLDAVAQQVNDRFSFLSESQRQDLINKQKQLEQIQQQAQQQFNTPPPPSFTPPPPPSGGGSGGGGRGGATTFNVTINANGVTTRELVDQIARELEQRMRRAA